MTILTSTNIVFPIRKLETISSNSTHSLTYAQVTALCRQNARSLALDVGVILHGDAPGELPEGVLGVLRIEGLDPEDTARHRPLWEQ